MVLDLGEKLNKSVLYEVKGSEISMNKDSFHILQDAFVHVLRNSIDHGIETPEERVSNGKDEIGQLDIICVQGKSELEILIRDDGKGINLQSVIDKALEKGIIKASEAHELTENEIYSLIFQPNFSTRKEVSEISGRGVGMDVVKQNLDQMKGDIRVNSELGKGTEISLKIPIPKVG